MYARRAFSLIELLVVMLIIALVVAIVLPALAAVRTRAKAAETNNLMANLSQATSAFKLDNNGRLPGYFSAGDMGHPDNTTRGFTVSQNVMLDLAGGIVQNNGIMVGPGNLPNLQVQVDDNLIGAATATNKNYFTPQAKFYKRLDGSVGGESRVGIDDHYKIRELVDAWGTPIMMWTPDPIAVGDIAAVADFARESSGGAAPTTARFYWNSNSAWLSSAAATVGPKRVKQGSVSMIGEDKGANRFTNMMGVFGNPASPRDAALNYDQIMPTAPRGSFIIQSAGVDGAYLADNDKAASLAGAGPLHYGLNFKSNANAVWTEGNKNTSLDLASKFDDIFNYGN